MKKSPKQESHRERLLWLRWRASRRSLRCRWRRCAASRPRCGRRTSAASWSRSGENQEKTNEKNEASLSSHLKSLSSSTVMLKWGLVRQKLSRDRQLGADIFGVDCTGIWPCQKFLKGNFLYKNFGTAKFLHNLCGGPGMGSITFEWITHFFSLRLNCFPACCIVSVFA